MLKINFKILQGLEFSVCGGYFSKMYFLPSFILTVEAGVVICTIMLGEHANRTVLFGNS